MKARSLLRWLITNTSNNMQHYSIDESPKTPLIRCDATAGAIRIRGRCLPENAHKFFDPLLHWTNEYIQSGPQSLHVELELVYINTSASKVILTFLKAIREVRNSIDVSVVWNHESDDEEMMETGLDYQNLIGEEIISLKSHDFEV
jgi:hypothetical protein